MGDLMHLSVIAGVASTGTVVEWLLFWLLRLGMLALGWWVHSPATGLLTNGLQQLTGGLGLLGVVMVFAPLQLANPGSHVGWGWLVAVAVVWLLTALWALRLSRSWDVADRERKSDRLEVWWSRRRLAGYVARAHMVGAVLMVVMAVVR